MEKLDMSCSYLSLNVVVFIPLTKYNPGNTFLLLFSHLQRLLAVQKVPEAAQPSPRQLYRQARTNVGCLVSGHTGYPVFGLLGYSLHPSIYALIIRKLFFQSDGKGEEKNSKEQ